MRKTEHGNGGYYHVLNRGVDKNLIFLDTADYQKFYEYLYLFNDVEYRNPGNVRYHNETLLASAPVLHQFRTPLVSILSYCLRPNHFHIFLCQSVDGGIELFLRKVEMGYAMYFNRKYGRQGVFFESRYKSIPIETDAHFLHIPRYIHLNGLDGTAYEWREGQIRDWDKAMIALNEFPWSSHHYYLGSPQELQVLDEKAIAEVIDTDNYESFLREWAMRPLPVDLELVMPDVSR